MPLVGLPFRATAASPSTTIPTTTGPRRALRADVLPAPEGQQSQQAPWRLPWGACCDRLIAGARFEPAAGPSSSKGSVIDPVAGAPPSIAESVGYLQKSDYDIARRAPPQVMSLRHQFGPF